MNAEVKVSTSSTQYRRQAGLIKLSEISYSSKFASIFQPSSSEQRLIPSSPLPLHKAHIFNILISRP